MRNRIIFVASLGAVFALSPLAIDMYLPALPAMANSLDATIDDIEASVAIFLLGFAAGQLVFGPLSDSYGRRPILLIGLCVFAAASFLCAFAQDTTQLYAFRFLQAIGGGASVAVFGLVKDSFDEKGSAQIISYIMAITAVAPLIAPILGGYLLVWLGWEAIFIVIGAASIVSILAVAGYIKEASHQTAQQQMSILLSFAGAARAYAGVFSNGSALAHILVGAFAFAGLFAFVAGSPFVYIEYFGVAEQHYGYLVGANAAAMVTMNVINAQLLHRMAPTTKTIAGALGIGGASAALLLVNGLGLGLWPLVAGVVAFVGLLGLVAANAIAGALASFENEAGAAAAVFGVIQFGLGALSSVLVSAWKSTDPTPMVVIRAACGFLALISSLPLLVRGKSLETKGEPSRKFRNGM